jgi:hypothetical protein
MGILHSRASKRRDRAQAAVLREEARALREQRRRGQHDRVTAEMEGRTEHPESWWREPTLASLLGRRKRQ